MKQTKLPITSLLVLVTALVLAAGTPVFAHEIGPSSGDDSTSSSSGSGKSAAIRPATVTKTETEDGTEVKVETRHSSLGELKQQAQDDLSQRKQKGKSLTDEQRKNVCQNRKQGLTTKFDRITTNSQRIQTRIDGVLQKAEDYKTSKNLNPTDWDSLVAAAESAQSASSDSITALKELKPTVDCNNTSVASDVATFKAAAAETRDNLKAYRTAVKAVLKSLIEAKQTTTTEGSN
jgi:hypothetical protein